MVEQSRPQPRHVLLVEDNEHEVRAVSRVLTRANGGDRITHCVRGEEALEMLSAGRSDFDVLLTDYRLPGVSGLELCKTLLAAGIDLPLVIMTGTGSERVAVEAMKAGVYDYLVKDPDKGYLELLPVVLAEAVRRHEDRVARQRAEESLQQSEKNLAEAQRIAHLGSFAEDVQTGELRWSEEAYRIFGLVPEGLSPDLQSWIDAIHPEDWEAVETAIQAARNPDVGQDRYQIEYRIVRPDGTVRTLEERGEAVYDSGRRPLRITGVFLDVTERKQLQEQLAQVRKIEAVGKLTGGVAHEFNNLLTVVLGYLELLEERVGAQHELGKLIARATQAAERGAEITKGLLAFGRKQLLRPRVIDLNAVISEVTTLMGGTLNEAIELKSSVAADLWKAKADPAQVERAMVNLVLNACDAMPEGGALTVEAANAHVDEALAMGDIETREGDYVMIAVTDSGTGMPPETLARAYEPFFTTKEVGKGTGLGLSMVYGFAKQSNGFVKIDSEEGRGTRVELYLPRVSEP